MGAKPEELKRDIEATRAQLGEDLDQLTEKVSPGRVATRAAEDAKSAASSLAARVSSTTNDLKPKVAHGAQKAKTSAGSALGTVRDRAEQNPQVAAAATKARESAGHAAQAVKGQLEAHPQVEAKAQQAKESASNAARTTSDKAKANPGAFGGITAGALALLTLLLVKRRRRSKAQRHAAMTATTS